MTPEFLASQRNDPIGVDRALRDLLGAGQGVRLEMGCGTGVHAATVRDLGWTCRPASCGTPEAGGNR